jgi:hypothetical protein
VIAPLDRLDAPAPKGGTVTAIMVVQIDGIHISEHLVLVAALLCDGRVTVAHGRECVARDPLALVKDLDCGAGDACLDHLADQLRRH